MSRICLSEHLLCLFADFLMCSLERWSHTHSNGYQGVGRDSPCWGPGESPSCRTASHSAEVSNTPDAPRQTPAGSGPWPPAACRRPQPCCQCPAYCSSPGRWRRKYVTGNITVHYISPEETHRGDRDYLLLTKSNLSPDSSSKVNYKQLCNRKPRVSSC